MRTHVELSPAARRQLESLPKNTAIRIGKKLRWYADNDNPLAFAKPLTGMPGMHRFRIGDYRAIFTIRRGHISILFVIAIKHRREAYS